MRARLRKPGVRCNSPFPMSPLRKAHPMNRLLIAAIVLSSVALVSLVGGTAQAQHPHSRSQVVIVNPAGYGGGYGGYGGYGGAIQYGGYNAFGNYGGYVAPYYPPS